MISLLEVSVDNRMQASPPARKARRDRAVSTTYSPAPIAGPTLDYAPVRSMVMATTERLVALPPGTLAPVMEG
jgi:hypothetical protein